MRTCLSVHLAKHKVLIHRSAFTIFSLCYVICYYLEFKEGTANRRASQSAKAKQQLRSPHCDQNDVDISSYDYDTRQDESVLEGTQNK